ncbi:MAG: rubrerythrin family protein [Haloarculaceae archaeon]
MDADSFLATVREAKATELDRLGSEKALLATTDAVLETAAVLRATAAAERRAAETAERWADDEPDERVRAAFADVAVRERDHYEQVLDGLDEAAVAADTDALHEHLRDLDGTIPRVAAGLVGRPLASARTLLQVVNFFVNEADEQTADRFRALRSDTEALAEEGAALLVDCCDSDDDWATATAAATRAVDVAYAEYVETLDGMGVDPKPIC